MICFSFRFQPFILCLLLRFSFSLQFFLLRLLLRFSFSLQFFLLRLLLRFSIILGIRSNIRTTRYIPPYIGKRVGRCTTTLIRGAGIYIKTKRIVFKLNIILSNICGFFKHFNILVFGNNKFYIICSIP